MNLTEAEARTKWCPFARVGNEAGCNRSGADFEFHTRCIASDCMAWRQGTVIVRSQNIDHEQELIKAGGKPVSGFRYALPGGYCGLAGNPESPK